MKKKLLCLLLLLACFLFSAPAAGAVSLSVDGAVQGVDAVLYNGSTYVPLRAASRLLDPTADVQWTGGRALVKTRGLTLEARPGDLYMEANGRVLYAPEGIRLSGGTMLVPLRALARAFDGTVSWDNGTKTARVARGGGAIASGSQFYEEDDLYWLSRIIQAEAGGEPFLGKAAVGNVILNRVESPAYPDSIYGVIFDRQWGVQFQPVANGTIYNTPSAESVLAAKLCLDGAKPVGGSLYFFNPALATSTWIAENCAYVTQVGQHVFYV